MEGKELLRRFLDSKDISGLIDSNGGLKIDSLAGLVRLLLSQDISQPIDWENVFSEFPACFFQESSSPTSGSVTAREWDNIIFIRFPIEHFDHDYLISHFSGYEVYSEDAYIIGHEIGHIFIEGYHQQRLVEALETIIWKTPHVYWELIWNAGEREKKQAEELYRNVDEISMDEAEKKIYEETERACWEFARHFLLPLEGIKAYERKKAREKFGNRLEPQRFLFEDMYPKRKLPCEKPKELFQKPRQFLLFDQISTPEFLIDLAKHFKVPLYVAAIQLKKYLASTKTTFLRYDGAISDFLDEVADEDEDYFNLDPDYLNPDPEERPEVSELLSKYQKIL